MSQLSESEIISNNVPSTQHNGPTTRVSDIACTGTTHATPPPHTRMYMEATPPKRAKAIRHVVYKIIITRRLSSETAQVRT